MLFIYLALGLVCFAALLGLTVLVASTDSQN